MRTFKDLVFGFRYNTTTLTCCQSELETDKAYLIRCLVEDGEECSLWIPKSVLDKSNDKGDWIQLPFWFDPTLKYFN